MALNNNVSMIEMEMTCQAWKPNTAEFVLHQVLEDYIQDSAASNDVMGSVSFNTRVNRVRKVGQKLEVSVAQLVKKGPEVSIVDSVEASDLFYLI